MSTVHITASSVDQALVTHDVVAPRIIADILGVEDCRIEVFDHASLFQTTTPIDRQTRTTLPPTLTRGVTHVVSTGIC